MAAQTNETNGRSGTDLQQEISEFKKELDDLLSGQADKRPGSAILIDQALAYLRDAEAHASKDASRSWHDLEQAKLTLNHERPDIFADGEPAEAPSERTVLLDRMYETWDELSEAKRRHPHLNTEGTVDWLLRGRKALDKDDVANAFYCVMEAKNQMLYAQRCSEQRLLSQILPIFVVLGYIASIVALLILGQQAAARVISVSATLQIPPTVFFWGFLGGVAWCMYSAAQWGKEHLFDWHTLPWYISQPWVSSILGAAASLVILAGLSAVTETNYSAPLSPTTMAILALVSFTAGFSTKSMWKLMDRTARRLLKDKSSAQDVSQATREEVLDATT